MKKKPAILIYFSDYFGIDPDVVESYGAFNVSLINDLPLFIDPFLLFNSEKQEYRDLHDGIIRYVTFLREKASSVAEFDRGHLRAWYTFSEVKQTWLGFSAVGNGGSGLGEKFARSLSKNLHLLFSDFGDEARQKVAQGSHLEKLCLIEDGVGRDNISDFTTNLIKRHLLLYTQEFARKHLKPEQRRTVTVPKDPLHDGLHRGRDPVLLGVDGPVAVQAEKGKPVLAAVPVVVQDLACLHQQVGHVELLAQGAVLPQEGLHLPDDLVLRHVAPLS